MPANIDQTSGSDAERFVEQLGKALHSFGSPAHRIEDGMQLACETLGLAGQFFSSPTAIFVSFGQGEERRTRLVRVEPGEVDLGKLEAVDGVLEALTGARLDLETAAPRLAAIVAAPPRYGPWLTTLAFALASGSAARFFGGGWREIAAAALVGLGIGLLAVAAGRRPTLGRIFEPLAAMLATFTAMLAAAWAAPLAPFVVTLAGLIVLVPGLTLTVALRELASRHLVSGSARLAGALLVFLTIGFGVALGNRLGIAAVGALPVVQPAALPAWTEAIALLAAAAGFTVLFRARPRDAGWIFAAGALAIAGSRTGVHLLGPELGAFVGALGVGLASNLYARLRQRTASVVQLPGLVLLVPGSLGFRSVSALLEQDTLAGVQTAFTMALIAIALVTGLLVANVFVPPRRNF